LYDKGTKLTNIDCTCKITILDDDKPGTLCFKNPKIKHPVTNSEVVINVERKHEADGIVSVKWRTVVNEESARAAKAGIDFEAASGTLTFENQEVLGEIKVKVLPRELEEGEERDEMFGV
jgi:hypothetical protein